MADVRVPLVSRSVRYGIVVVVASVVLTLSVVETGTTATPPGPLGLVGVDKWTHALGYAALAAMLAYASVGQNHHEGRVALVALLAVAFGIGVELVQWPIPYRTASAADVLADTVGVGLLALCWWWLGRFARFVPTAERSQPTR